MMNYLNRVCSFTGYRTQKLNYSLARSSLNEQDVEEAMRAIMLQMLDRDFSEFRCGMAIGADLMFARLSLELRRKYPSLVKFTAVIPCLDHDIRWNEADKRLCREITELADDVVLVSNVHYFNGCMAKRNRYLVDTCDELLAVYDGQSGGTMQTVNYAKGKGKKVSIIDPSRELLITLRESGRTKKPIRSLLFTGGEELCAQN
jgi:uncharacterized phage-like protein YoqJ